MIELSEFVPDFGRIGKELIDAEILIDNGIEPYASLHCFEEGRYNIAKCFENRCVSLVDCLNRFILGGYISRNV